MKIQIWLTSLTLGFVLGLLFILFNYTADAETRIQGIPFPFAIFKLENRRWFDYIGPGHIILANFAVGFATGVLPVVGFFFIIRLITRPRADRKSTRLNSSHRT